MSTKRWTGLVVAAAGVLWCTVGHAADDSALAGLVKEGADAVIAEADARANAFEDQKIRIRLTVQGGSNDGRSLEFTTITKGMDRRAIRMHAPADIKGLGVVIRGRDEIYVRLPGEDPRRVASHARKHSFQGTHWDFDDMAMIKLGVFYKATSMKDKGDHLVIGLDRREGVDLSYDKLVVQVDKSLLLFDRIEYFTAGEQVKVQVRENPKVMDGGQTTYQKVTMTDVKSGHSTLATVLGEKINTGVSNRTFKKSWLVREF